MANNKEMGVLIDKHDPSDAQLFEDAYKEVDYINETSQRFELNPPKMTYGKTADTKVTNAKPSNISNRKTGYCIRTGVPIPFDPERPLSYDAFKIWNQFGDPDYKENYCHFSGEPSNGETCVRRPILKKNWQKAMDAIKN